jgi:hypothetical protein
VAHCSQGAVILQWVLQLLLLEVRNMLLIGEAVVLIIEVVVVVGGDDKVEW